LLSESALRLNAMYPCSARQFPEVHSNASATACVAAVLSAEAGIRTNRSDTPRRAGAATDKNANSKGRICCCGPLGGSSDRREVAQKQRPPFRPELSAARVNVFNPISLSGATLPLRKTMIHARRLLELQALENLREGNSKKSPIQSVMLPANRGAPARDGVARISALAAVGATSGLLCA